MPENIGYDLANEKIKKMCQELEISENEWNTITGDELKKKHRVAILKWHPDKNGGAHSDKFIEVNNAYTFLLSVKNSEYSFLKSKLNMNTNAETAFNLSNIYNKFNKSSFYTLLMRFFNSITEETTYSFLNKLDTTNLKKIYTIIEKHFPDELLLSYIKKIMEEKTESYIILNPNLSDLLDNNIYKLRLNNETYIVPLWHHELIYDHCGNEIIIECLPVLNENMMIDENNNLFVKCVFNIEEVFNQSHVEVILTNNHSVYFDARELKMCDKEQQIKLNNCGISSINEKNIYDISQKQDINLIVYLHP